MSNEYAVFFSISCKIFSNKYLWSYKMIFSLNLMFNLAFIYFFKNKLWKLIIIVIRQTNWVYILKQLQNLWRKKIAVHQLCPNLWPNKFHSFFFLLFLFEKSKLHPIYWKHNSLLVCRKIEYIYNGWLILHFFLNKV